MAERVEGHLRGHFIKFFNHIDLQEGISSSGGDRFICLVGNLQGLGRFLIGASVTHCHVCPLEGHPKGHFNAVGPLEQHRSGLFITHWKCQLSLCRLEM